VLSWTAPGDDGPAGIAARYHVCYSTQPINGGDLGGCVDRVLFDVPKPAGGPEQVALEMPDPDTRYYFVVQAEDEAGNRGAPSNVEYTYSYVEDVDGDGLPNQWEEAFGFNPYVPGEQFADPDGDALNNLQEYQHGTLPNQWDTDGDRLSDGLEVSASTSPTDGGDPPTGTALTAKQYADGRKVGCAYLAVTAAFPDGSSYADEWDRSGGIRLDGVAAAPGTMIEVIGTLATASGERCLTSCTYRAKEPVSLAPLGMTNKSLGGGDWRYDPVTGKGQEGVEGGSGLNNIGLLVKTWGRVRSVDAGSKSFVIDDGSNVNLKCVAPTAVSVPAVNQYVAVTGISSCEAGLSGRPVRLLRAREPTDIRAFPE